MSGLRFLDGTLEKMKNDCNKFNLISQRMQNLCSPSILWNFKNALFSILDVGIAIFSDAFGFLLTHFIEVVAVEGMKSKVICSSMELQQISLMI